MKKIKEPVIIGHLIKEWFVSKTGQTEIISTAKELCVNDYFKKFKQKNK